MATETRVDVPDVPTVVTAGRSLALALAEYRSHPTSLERLWDFQEAHWKLNRFAMGLSERDIVISDIPYTEKELRKFMGLGGFRKPAYPDSMLFLPEVCSTTPDGFLLLSKAYPEMRWDQQGVEIVQNVDRRGNRVSLFGWLRYEKSINALFTDTNEDQAVEIILDRNRQGQTLNVYAEAGQQSKLLTGQYLDEGSTWVRIISSRVHGQMVYAGFDADGYCFFHWVLASGRAESSLGVRSVGLYRA